MDSYEWEKVYREQGAVQNDVLPTVVRAAEILRQKGFASVLDLGCGSGRHTVYLARLGFTVTGADISETGVRITGERLRKENLGNSRCLAASMTSLPFANGSFDAIVCVWSTGHGLWADLVKSVDEMRRVLRPGGFLIADFMSVEDETFGSGTMVEPGTFVGGMPGLPGLPNRYSTLEEVEGLLAGFSEKNIYPYDYRYRAGDDWKTIKAFVAEAFK